MEPISYSVKDVLVRQGIANGMAGRPRLRGIGAGLPTGRTDRPATAQAKGEDASRSGMGKGTPAETGASQQEVGKRQQVARTKGEPFPGNVADFVAIATSKWRIVRTRPLLMIMDGGA